MTQRTEPRYIKRDSDGVCLQICKDGIEEHWNKLVKEDGLSYRKAAQTILESIKHVANEPGAPELPTANAIIDLGRAKKPTVGSSHSLSEEEILEKAREIEEQRAWYEQGRQWLAWGAEALERGLERMERKIEGYDEMTEEEQLDAYVKFVAEEETEWEKRHKEFELRRQQTEYAEEIHQEWLKQRGNKARYTKYRKYVREKEEARRSSWRSSYNERRKQKQSNPFGDDFNWDAIGNLLNNRNPDISPVQTFVTAAFDLFPEDQWFAISQKIYQVFAKKLHPDVGGDTLKFQQLNALNEKLKEAVSVLRAVDKN